MLLAGVMLFTVGCTDDSTDPGPDGNNEKTTFQLVAQGSWRVESGTIEPPITIEIQGAKITVDEYWDLLAYNGGGEVKECDRDNIMFLKSDSTVLLDEGPTKCDPGDPQSESGGTWLLLNDDSQLQFSSFPFDPEGKPQTFDIMELTESKMNLRLYYDFKNPVDGKTTVHEIKLNYVNVD